MTPTMAGRFLNCLVFGLCQCSLYIYFLMLLTTSFPWTKHYVLQFLNCISIIYISSFLRFTLIAEINQPSNQSIFLCFSKDKVLNSTHCIHVWDCRPTMYGKSTPISEIEPSNNGKIARGYKLTNWLSTKSQLCSSAVFSCSLTLISL